VLWRWSISIRGGHLTTQADWEYATVTVCYTWPLKVNSITQSPWVSMAAQLWIFLYIDPMLFQGIKFQCCNDIFWLIYRFEVLDGSYLALYSSPADSTLPSKKSMIELQNDHAPGIYTALGGPWTLMMASQLILAEAANLLQVPGHTPPSLMWPPWATITPVLVVDTTSTSTSAGSMDLHH
jgi:hypothetical protein